MKSLMKASVIRIATLLFLMLMVGAQSPIYAHPLQGPNSFIASVASSAQGEMRDSGVPASFTIAQASYESNWNNVSTLASGYNNYHGIMCSRPNEGLDCVQLSGRSWNRYSSKSAGFLWHGRWLHGNRRYANAFNFIDNPVEFARQVAIAGYCPPPDCDPNRYADIVNQRISGWDMTRYGDQETPFVGVYYNNTRLSGQPVFSAPSSNLAFDWGSSGPRSPYFNYPNIGADHFSVRWKAKRRFSAGRYRFHTLTDDGVRLWVDDNPVINRWRDQAPTESTGEINLSEGFHWIRMEYYERGGGAVARLWWERIGSGPSNCSDRYRAEYYNNRSLSGSPTFVRCEGWPINHDWGSGGPGHGVGNDNFSAHWTGRAHIDAGTYTFIARADDGVRVWLDGNRIIDAWRDQAPTEYRTTRHVSGGMHDVKVEYYEHFGGAVAQFRWERVSSDSHFKIVAEHSSKCLDVSRASRDNGARVIQWDCHGGTNQQWRFVPVGNYFKIVARHSSKCLDVHSGSRDNGARVIQWDCHGGDNQLWRLVPAGRRVKIVAKHSGKCLDVYGASRDNGARIIQWDCHGGSNQLWKRMD